MHHLVGVAEIAEMLGVSRQRVYQIIHSEKGFPEPEAILSAGWVWKKSEVEWWMARRPRRRR